MYSADQHTRAASCERDSVSAVTPPPDARDPQIITESSRERLRRAFAAVTLLYAGYYLVWRWTTTLNPDALWFAVPLALAETCALMTTAFFIYNVWRMRTRVAPAAPPGLSVDVFITTYNEPLELIRKTALGARGLTYPNRTYILDDGRRSDVRALAAELGLDYIRRETNEGAKAGNLNHALRCTAGDLILQLDADHVPMPHMLDRLLGYFEDERLAFVQAPQCFYNYDSYTGHEDSASGRYYAEQDIFFNVIQPGKDRHNAAFFCGSCAVIRRSALASIGGFSAHSITEDFETSLRLHAQGWRSAYHREPLAYGLAARTAESFHTQRARWGRGTLQVLRRFNPLTLRGLTLAQRLCYFYSVLVYLDGLPRLIFYASPLVYLYFGVLPIRSADASFLAHFIPLFIAAVALNQVLARGHGAPFWLLERNNLAKVWTHTLALTGYFTRRSLRFGVTNKGVGGVSVTHVLPHALLLLATISALAWGTFAFIGNGGPYGTAGSAALPFLVNVLWASWTGIVTVLVLRTALRSRERRVEYRFREIIPVGVAHMHEDERQQLQLGGLLDINSAGAALRVGTAVPVGARLALVLALPEQPLTIGAVVVRCQPERTSAVHSHVIGVSFAEADRVQRDRIALHCLQHVTPFLQVEATRPQVIPLFRRDRRQERRTRVTAAALLRVAGNRDLPLLASARDVSARGVCFESFAPIPEGAMLTYEIPQLRRLEHGEVVHQRQVPTSSGSRHIIRVARRAVPEPLPELRVHAVTAASSEAWQPLTTAARVAFTASAIVLLLVAFTKPAASQFKPGYVVGVEAADNGQRVYLAGVWFTRAQPGWSPTASVFGFRIEPADHPELDAIWAINPAIGVRYQTGAGAVQSTVGYTWQSASGDGLAGEAARVSSGATTSLQGDYWGSGAIMAQAIASYAWGGEGYVWSRARATLRLTETAAGVLRLGAELGWQGNDDYDAFDTGGVLEWHRLPVVVSLAAGYRSVGAGAADSAPYISIATVVMP